MQIGSSTYTASFQAYSQTAAAQHGTHTDVVTDIETSRTTIGSEYQNAEQSQALLYRTTLESVSAQINIRIDLSALTQNTSGDIDVSPEATADRIIGYSTGLFEKFKEQHPNEDPATVEQKFMDTINKGITQGFAEAREILSGLGALQGDIAGNIDKTWDLVQTGLQKFDDDFKHTLASSASSTVAA